MKISKLKGDGKFLFIAMMQAALRMKDVGFEKKDFVLFAEETWNSLELNDPKDLANKLQSMMMEDLSELMEKLDQ